MFIFAFMCKHYKNTKIMKILMVCLGNICRSPLAEGILRRKVEEKDLNWQVDIRLIMNEANPGRNEAVPDPYWDDDGFEKVYQMLDKACTTFTENYKS